MHRTPLGSLPLPQGRYDRQHPALNASRAHADASRQRMRQQATGIDSWEPAGSSTPLDSSHSRMRAVEAALPSKASALDPVSVGSSARKLITNNPLMSIAAAGTVGPLIKGAATALLPGGG